MRRHLTRRMAVVGAAVGVVVVCRPVGASAGVGQAEGYGSVSDGTITATASSSSPGSGGSGATGTGPSAGGSTASGAQVPQCFYAPAPPNFAASLGPGPGGPGSWYAWYCTLPTLSITDPRPALWVPAGSSPTGSAAPSVPGLLQQAADQAQLVEPTIGLDPPGEQVVNVSSWLWIQPGQWHAVTATATAGAVTATVVAAPVSVLWNLGDGTSITCAGPGVPYDPEEPADAQSTYCQHTWTESSARQPGGVYQVTATIEYEITTTVAGAPDPTPDLGSHFGPTATVEVPVSEIEALGTSP
jgi:hypothetical protein